MSTIGNMPSYVTSLFTSTSSLFGSTSSGNASTPLTTISSTSLLDYFSGTDQANAERTAVHQTNTASSTSSTATQPPPWDEAQPSQLAENVAVLATTNFIDPAKAKLDGRIPVEFENVRRQSKSLHALQCGQFADTACRHRAAGRRDGGTACRLQRPISDRLAAGRIFRQFHDVQQFYAANTDAKRIGDGYRRSAFRADQLFRRHRRLGRKYSKSLCPV